MAVHVHPTAIVDPGATLDEHVSIGPYCVVGAGAFIGSHTKLISHVQIMGNVRLGHHNTVYPFCVLGAEPQDIHYDGAPTWVVIGDHNVFREMITIHRATTKELGITRIGSHNYLMANCHVAHDCNLGSHIAMANFTAFSGHVHVHDYATFSGQLGVHQFTTIGSHSFVAGMSRIVQDVPPFMLVEGNPAMVRCVNIVGLKRRGFASADIHHLTEAHRLLYRVKTGAAAARAVLEEGRRMTEPVRDLFAFLEQQHQGKHGRARERLRAA